MYVMANPYRTVVLSNPNWPRNSTSSATASHLLIERLEMTATVKRDCAG